MGIHISYYHHFSQVLQVTWSHISMLQCNNTQYSFIHPFYLILISVQLLLHFPMSTSSKLTPYRSQPIFLYIPLSSHLISTSHLVVPLINTIHLPLLLHNLLTCMRVYLLPRPSSVSHAHHPSSIPASLSP